MRIFFNELSIEGQFNSVHDFKSSFFEVMEMRKKANQFGYKLECSKSIFERLVTVNRYFPTVLDDFSKDEKRAILLWVSKQGPFWQEKQSHGENDYVTVDGNEEIFNGDIICEACVINLNNISYSSLVSITPSSWCMNPINAIYHFDDENSENVTISNYWEFEPFTAFLDSIGYNISSWTELEKHCFSVFANLTFSKDCFQPLTKHPFIKSASNKIISQLSILDRLCSCVDKKGGLNEQGAELYDKYFKSNNALFTDSSDSEKNDFKEKLTFKNPDNPSEKISCSMHGKINTNDLPIRLHFNWFDKSKKLFYVTYIGQKITKR